MSLGAYTVHINSQQELHEIYYLIESYLGNDKKNPNSLFYSYILVYVLWGLKDIHSYWQTQINNIIWYLGLCHNTAPVASLVYTQIMHQNVKQYAVQLHVWNLTLSDVQSSKGN